MYKINITGANGKQNSIATKTKREALRITKTAVNAGAESVLAYNVRTGEKIANYVKPVHGQRPSSGYMVAVSTLAKSGVGRNDEYLFTDTLAEAMALTEARKATPNTSILVYDKGGAYNANLVYEYANY